MAKLPREGEAVGKFPYPQNASDPGPDPADALAGDPPSLERGQTIEEEMGIMRGAPPRYTDTDLRALALEHAVATRSPDDDVGGESLVARAGRVLSFLNGSN